MVKEKLKLEISILKIKWIIYGFHKKRGLLKGKKVFSSQNEAHNHWKKIELLKQVTDYSWYIVLPK